MSEPNLTDRGQFLAEISEAQHRAESAFIRGEVAPRLELWSHREPVSVFAALGPSKVGWTELEPMFRSVAARLSAGTDTEFEIVAFDVSGDTAWTAGFLRFRVSIDGDEPHRRTLRMTHVYRREAGQWRIVHEHSNWEPVAG
jgi:ketosteroid isomerase-like protein